MPGRKGMKWGQHIFGDDDYDPHGRPASVKNEEDLYDKNGQERNFDDVVNIGPKIAFKADKDQKTGQRISNHSGKFVTNKKDGKTYYSRDRYGEKHYYQNALEMGNKIAGTYSHMSDADRSLMAKYKINMNPRRTYGSLGKNGSGWGDFNTKGVEQARRYRDAVNAKNRNSRSDLGNALHDASEAIKARYKDIRGNVKRDMVNLRNKFNKTAIGQLVKEYKKRKARAKNDLARAAKKLAGK